MQASFSIERRTSEVVVGEVSAMGNSTEKNPLEWRANDYLVNIYIRMSRKSSQDFERNYCLRSVTSRFWANCFLYKLFMPLSSGLPYIAGVIPRVFHTGGQMHVASARGKSIAQKK